MTTRLGIDLGGTAIKLGIVDESNRIIAREKVRTPEGFEQTADAMASAAKRLIDKAGLDILSLPFVGIGVPSTVHPLTGRMVLANNKGWEDAPVREAVESRLGLPVLVANDADCALSGEAAMGAAVNIKNVLLLTLGTGVGGAMLMDGQIYAGADGMGMEVGHTPLIAGGRLCTCGAKGCLEASVSATGLIALTEEIIGISDHSLMHQYVLEHDGHIGGRTAFACAAQGDVSALAVVSEYCSLLAQGIGGLVNIFRPQMVIIGGGVSHEGDKLLHRVREMIPKFILAYEIIGGPEIRLAQLGNDAGVIGAAHLDKVLHMMGRTIEISS
ncbi:MAG: ROK family protein [Clostridiales bacterium]|nr:ROK family protein [Clostridiales bacterium]